MKYKMVLIITIILFLIINVYAQNEIYDISIDVYIDKDAVATIEETWNVKGQDGTEWYKVLRDLGESHLSDFTVSMDNIPLKLKKPWNIKGSLSDKKGYYGINYSGADTELCFGKYDYNQHVFKLKYKLDNYIFNTNDSQVLYWTYLSKLTNVNFHDMSITIRSYYDFPDTLDVWGYGYKGYAYVKDGVISLSNEENTNMTGNYVVALVKFPPETFITDYFVDYFNTFDDVYYLAENDTFKYDYNNGTSNSSDDGVSRIFEFLPVIFFFGFISIIIAIVAYATSLFGYGYKNNKKISRKETLPFRDIPCNKNIFYANCLIYLNGFGYRDTNILGAIILKWLREGKISIDNNKRIQTIKILNKEETFDTSYEQTLFKLMYCASDNGNLDTKTFKKWAKNHYSEFLSLFKRMKDQEISKLREENHIYKRINKEECKKENVMDDRIYEDSKKLLGLELFLEEFSNMKNKEAIEVHLWDEYLIFAYLFGIADKVAKQLKNLYPEIYEQNQFDYRYIYFINDISKTSVTAATQARSAAENYSSGGGGFSSGGGGGGSFGGGGFSGGGSR